ncbi:MAG: TetR/AcrR family transcriptional regulator [bacterium]|nr:TetR/AcrR family transcriptional regulator [bacterium]
MTRRTHERQTRKQYILDAARLLFAAKGLDDVRMEEIAAAADYTRRTLYSYFRSRDEICLLIHIEDNTRRWALQQEAMRGAVAGLAKIGIWAETLFTFARENPQALQLQAYWDYCGIDRSKIGDETFGKYEGLNDELAAGLRTIFNLGIADGSLRPDLQVDMCISQFLYTLRSVIRRALSTTYSFAEFIPEVYLRHYLDLFGRSIRNNEG